MKSLILSTLMIGTAALGTGALGMSQATAKDAAKNIVLVHGAFADATSWDKVSAILGAKGYKVTAVRIPLTSLADDVAATRAAIDAQDGPTILVGHSWGGVVIGEAGSSEKVKALVYVAAFAPNKGETLNALLKSAPPTEGLKAIHPDDKGFLSIDVAAFPTVFAADVPRTEAEVMARHQIPFNSVGFSTPVEVAAWSNKPSFYVVTTEDQMLAPAAQKFFSGRMKAKVTEIAASHAGAVSKAGDVARVIEEATR